MPNLLTNEWFKSTAALAIGWSLNEIGHYLLARRERRKAISNALSDLLELRYQFIIIDIMARELTKPGVLPAGLASPNAEAQFRILFPTLMPQLFPKWQENSQEMSQRYNASVTLVASIDPILGYQLRSKDLVQHIFQMLNGLVAQDAQAAQFWPEVNKALYEEVGKEFNSYIKRLAWKLGPIKRWQVSRLFASERIMPSAVKRVLDIIKNKVEEPQPPIQPASSQEGQGTSAGA